MSIVQSVQSAIPPVNKAGYPFIGTTVVLASLWPLRDDEAQRVTSGLARYLGRGYSVAQSLALARRESIRQGMPASAWAGLVALGNAECRIVAEDRSEDAGRF